MHSPCLSDVGLQQLTALTGVTELALLRCSGLSAVITREFEIEQLVGDVVLILQRSNEKVRSV